MFDKIIKDFNQYCEKNNYNIIATPIKYQMVQVYGYGLNKEFTYEALLSPKQVLKYWKDLIILD